MSLKETVIGIGVGVAGLAGYQWWQRSRAAEAAPALPGAAPGGATPGGRPIRSVPVDELNAAAYNFARCLIPQGCTRAEIDYLSAWINNLVPETPEESAFLSQLRAQIAGMTPRVGHATGHADEDESCCAACAAGKPCTGACSRKEPERGRTSGFA